MSNLILCTSGLSENPYYIVGLGMNIYSIEELCFYLTRDAYIIDNDIMDESLCDYIENELSLKELADRLRDLINIKASLGEFVTTILEMVGYLDDEELRRIRQVLVDNASLSFYQKRKSRADNLLRAGKFTRAIDEYQYILQSMRKEEDEQVYAELLHNIGSAYAQLFIYDKAAFYYRESNEVYKSREALIHYLQALRMTMKKETYERHVLRMGYDDSLINEAQERFILAHRKNLSSEYSEELEEVKKLKIEEKMDEYYKHIEEMFGRWKQEYRDQMVVRAK